MCKLIRLKNEPLIIDQNFLFCWLCSLLQLFCSLYVFVLVGTITHQAWRILRRRSWVTWWCVSGGLDTTGASHIGPEYIDWAAQARAPASPCTLSWLWQALLSSPRRRWDTRDGARVNKLGSQIPDVWDLDDAGDFNARRQYVCAQMVLFE